MLVSIGDNGIVYMDKKPVIENFRVNIDPSVSGGRMKFEYITPSGDSEPVDLKFGYKLPNLTLFNSGNMYISLLGQELERDVPLNLQLSFSIPGGLKIKGRIGPHMINEENMGGNPLRLLQAVKGAILACK